MQLKALDQVQVTAVRPHPLLPGEKFEVSADIGAMLLKKQPKLFQRMDADEKAQQTPKNKSAPTPPNKRDPSPADKAAAAKKALAMAEGPQAKFAAAAKKVLGKDIPGDKDGIVAALTALVDAEEPRSGQSGDAKKPEDMSDEELKAFVAAKGVVVADQPREELLALAAGQ